MKLKILVILVGENNLCELIEDVNSDEITRQLKVAEVCAKSIPENDNFYDEITSFGASLVDNFSGEIPNQEDEKFCRCDVDSRYFRSQRYK